MTMRGEALFSEGEQAAFNATLMNLTQRHTYEQDPIAAVNEARRLGVRWWHRGRILVHGPGFAPERIVREREGR